MKLRTIQVKEFKSIWNSNAFDVDKVACLVGKNEAGNRFEAAFNAANALL